MTRTKIRPGHLAVSGALKTDAVFHWGKIPAQQVLCRRRSKVSARRPYAPDTRGVCFQGPSRALWYFKHPAPLRITAAARAWENEIRFFDRSVRYRAKRSACSVHGKGKFHSSAPLHCAVTADAGLPLFTRERAGAAGSFGVSAAA